MSTPLVDPQMLAVTEYERDFYAWALKNAELLRQRRFAEIDVEHIAEELEDMGKSQKQQFTNRLGVLLAHLLKWRYQPDQRSSSWRGTLKEQRRKLNRLLQDSPSLKYQSELRLTEAYGDALAIVEHDTGWDESHFPATCPFTLEQALDEDYWPE